MPTHSLSFMYLGIVLSELGDLINAENAFNKSMELAKEDSYFYENIVMPYEPKTLQKFNHCLIKLNYAISLTKAIMQHHHEVLIRQF